MLSSLSSGLYRSTAMSLLFSRARLTDSSSDRSRVGRSGDVGGGDGRGATGSWARARAGRPNDAAKIKAAIARLVRSMSERPPPLRDESPKLRIIAEARADDRRSLGAQDYKREVLVKRFKKSDFNVLNVSSW